MNVVINGQSREIKHGQTVWDVLVEFALNHDRVAVECNGNILVKEGYASHLLEEGDVLEIVRFVGGG